jgi:hypothetical protein
VRGYLFTHTFVIDQGRRLLWSRNLYAIGDTTVLFKGYDEGRETLQAAYDRLAPLASAVRIGGLIGWRLATRTELDALFKDLDLPSIYAYFRHRSIEGPRAPGVIGAFSQAVPQRVLVDGVFYTNTLQRRVALASIPPLAERNPYGTWLVQPLTPQIERELVEAEPLLKYFEPIEEQILEPLQVFEVTKRADADDAFDVPSEPPREALVSTTLRRNTRFYAHYNLKPIPRGALVSAEVVLRGTAYGGEPSPTVTVAVLPGEKLASRTPRSLWNFAGGQRVGIWQMPGNARLELPPLVANNASNTQGELILAFSANVNSCGFEIPTLVVRYVREENLLSRRSLP